MQYKTIVISDVHLGSKGSKVKELVKFLKNHQAQHIILNGDIIDGWQLSKGSKWKRKHTRLFKFIMKSLENKNTRVTYIRGNHDDFLDEVLPLTIGNFSIVKDYIYESFGKKYYVCHGDIFDSISTHFRWIAKLGDVGYTFLLWLNKIFNNRRIKKGLPYYSLSQAIKSKVKTAVSFISNFEEVVSQIAADKKCTGIICGHIHAPANKYINGIHYLNSGDWIESLSALTEDFQGNWHIHYYNEFVIQKANSTISIFPSYGELNNINIEKYALV